MSATATKAKRDSTFLARVYLRERNVTSQCMSGSKADRYVLPSPWAPGVPIWKKLSAHCHRADVDPIRYIRWSLEPSQVGLPAEWPEPNRLLEKRRLDAFKEDVQKVRARIKQQYTMEARLAKASIIGHQRSLGVERKVAWLKMVTDRRLLLSPLFRYTACLHCGGSAFEAPIEDLIGSAAVQFSIHPAVNAAVYGRLAALPPGFSQWSAKIYAREVDDFAKRSAGVEH